MNELTKLTETLARVYEVKPAEMRRRLMAAANRKHLRPLIAADGTLAWREEAIAPVAEPEPEAPTAEEAREAVREARQAAYRELVDPLTAEISRLRDMAPDDPRIAEAEAEREAAVAEIVAAHPYPAEEA